MALPERLSPHFTLSEAMISQRAARAGIDNTPPPEILERMIQVSAPGMEAVKAILGHRGILVSSWFRCEAVNAMVGGSPAHPSGYAIDFTCPSFGSPLAVAKAIAASDLRYDQLIHEFGSWVHISFAPRLRQMDLTIGGGKGTRPGLLPI